jgi:type IV pilus assembly protein PilV
MLNIRTPSRRRSSGFSLLEVLVTLIIVAFGLMGLAALMMRIQSAEVESYQRVQALLLVNDMAGRISTNKQNAAAYVTAVNSMGATNVVGTGDSVSATCAGYAAGSADRDTCEWSNALKGNSEIQSGGINVGAMIGGRGCITQIQAADPSAGVCQPGIYEISVAWQGVVNTAAPGVSCGQTLYGAEGYRRAVSSRVTVGLPQC